MGIKLSSIRFNNYLDVAAESVSIDFHPLCTVLCGPNNSGKTTVLTAISLFANGLNPYSASGGSSPSAHTTIMTHEMFNFRSEAIECYIEAMMTIDRTLLDFELRRNDSETVQLKIGRTLGTDKDDVTFANLDGADALNNEELKSLQMRLLGQHRVFSMEERLKRIIWAGRYSLIESCSSLPFALWHRSQTAKEGLTCSN